VVAEDLTAAAAGPGEGREADKGGAGSWGRGDPAAEECN